MDLAIKCKRIPRINFGTDFMESGFAFYKDESTYALLLNQKYGTIVLLDKSLINLARNDLGIIKYDDVYFKLKQRHFITSLEYPESLTPVVYPSFFLIDLTTHCNLNCTYCFRRLNGETIKDVVLDRACEKIKENCRRHQISHISIQPWGGEPLLCFDKIVRIYNNFLDSGLHVAIFVETNGTLLSEEIISKCLDMKIHLGISLDGCKRVHDAQRPFSDGRGSFDVIVDNIRLAKRMGYDDLSIIAVLTRNGLDYIEESTITFIDNIGVSNVKFNPVHDSVFQDNIHLLSTAALKKSFMRVFNFCEKRIDNGYGLNEGNVFQRIDNLLHGTDNNICFSRGCQGGYRMLSIGLEGGIFPCELTDHPSERLGDVFETATLSQMVERSLDDKIYFKLPIVSKCLNCPWLHFCRGGCKACRLHHQKTDFGFDTLTCSVNWTLYPLIINRLLDDAKYEVKLLRY